jgi:cytoskeletal protein RodZ
VSESQDSEPPHPRVRTGSHRARRNLLGALLPSVLAVAAVAALITSLAVWQSEKDTATSAAAATSSKTVDQNGEAEKAGAGTPATTAPASTPAAGPTTKPPSATPEPSSPAPSETAETEKPEPAREMAVVVLNQTTRRGLAAQIAAELQAKGWAVSGVGNFTGVVPATTVYYPPGAGEQALVLAEDLPTEPRTRPRFGNLSTSSLTIVVTDSYPG